MAFMKKQKGDFHKTHYFYTSNDFYSAHDF